MTTVIEIPDGPTEREIPGEETTTVESVIETALEIVEVIEEAKEDAEDNGKIEVLARLAAIELGIANLFTAISALGELVTPPAVEELIEELEEEIEEPELTPETIEETTVEEVQVPPEKEEVPEVITPQIKVKKSTRWV